MRYFAYGADGAKYGPADLATLQAWRAENRLNEETLLEPEVGGSPFPAKSLAELYPELQERQSYGQAPWTDQNTSQSPAVRSQHDSLATLNWVLGALSIFVCPLLLGISSIVIAHSLASKGHPQAKALKIFSVICLCAGLILNWIAIIALRKMGIQL